MVLVGRHDIGNVKDFVELVSIDYACKRAGGPIEDWTTAKFQSLQTGDKLYIVGHGAIGLIGDFSAAELVDGLTNGARALAKEIVIDIIFTSCNAGLGDSVTDSTVTQLRKGLEAAGYKGARVMGACGASVKADVTGTEYAVINPDPAKAGKAFKMEARLKRLLKPQEKLDVWLATPEGGDASIEKRAEHAAAISQLFYTQFAAEMQKESLVLDYKQSISSQRTFGLSPKVATLVMKFGG